ncbi:hypothetical protein RNZ50_15760 [Paracoccaceae bacterium Fryx2]|nr:hypothetical protein [Paracoccaceae bacterium Fryx2]
MKRPPVPVTDHAVIRYLERVVGIDVEALRDEIRAKVEPGVRLGACGVRSGGFNYRIIDGVVVTIVLAGHEDEPSGKPVTVKPAPGRRERGA